MIYRFGRTFKLILAILMVFSFLTLSAPSVQPAQAAPRSASVSDAAGLRTAIADGGTQTITLTASFTVTGGIEIPANADITLIGNHTLTHMGAPVTAGGSPAFIALTETNSSLTISGVTITRGASQPLSTGIIATGNSSLTLQSGNISGFNPGGVHIRDAAAFVMNGGAIHNNLAPSGLGGGVFLADNATFEMTNGNINNNLALSGGGGLHLIGHANFEMTGGAIHHNSVFGGNGGGLLLANNASFELDGGMIHHNNTSGNSGGGVYLSDNASFVMDSGELWVNGATSGGSVFAGGASLFEMNGGEIHSNTMQAGNGLGVTVAHNATFEMNGGVIHNNSLTFNGVGLGGGVFVTDNASFVMLDGIITENIANHGGGVHIQPPANFAMHNGEITENGAAGVGGGVFFGTLNDTIPSGILNINGGLIADNTAAYGGGIIVLRDTDSLHISGNTTISGNFALSSGGGIFVYDATANFTTAANTAFSNNSTFPIPAIAPPTNPTALFPNIGFASVSTFDHPVNNFDINHPDEYTLKFYGITYHANDNTGKFSVDYAITTLDNYVVLDPAATNFPPQPGFTFAGWTRVQDGSGVRYQPGTTIPLTDGIHLYAQWERVPDPLPPLPPPPSELHLAYMIGNQHGTFCPVADITRAEVATILARTQLLDFVKGIQTLPPGMERFEAFADVAPGDWHFFYIAWAYDAGLVQGFSGYFRPNDLISREEVAAMMVRTETVFPAGDLSGFGDANVISDWARDYVYTAYRTGLMIGDEGLFRPTANITRAEVATTTNRTLGRIDSVEALRAITVANLPDARRFPDVSESTWYFPSVLGAANDHRLTRDANGTINWIEFVRN